MPISTRIRQIRLANGLSRREFADELGIPYSTLTNYENGTRTPSYDFLFKLLNRFDGTTMDYLLCLTDSPSQGNLSVGLCADTDKKKGLLGLLHAAGYSYYVDVEKNRYTLSEYPSEEDGPPVEVKQEEVEQLFEKLVEYTRFIASSLYKKAADRDSSAKKED